MDSYPRPLRELRANKATVKIYKSRRMMGEAAAEQLRERIRDIMLRKNIVSIVFASAPSQEEFLSSLKRENINWQGVVAFHLDEYIGISNDAPQSFANFLKKRLFNEVNPGKTYYINGLAEKIQAEIERYENLIREYGIDIACVGIGENGHLAFNDPHVADFNDPLIVKIVDLDKVSRQQQVNDGCFENLDQVPKKALTLTMSTILNSEHILAVVPARQKSIAVRDTIHGEISTKCPASILRKHKSTVIFLDMDSASLI